MASAAVAVPASIEARSGAQCAVPETGLGQPELLSRATNLLDNGQDININIVMHFCCSAGEKCPRDEIAQAEIELMNSFVSSARITFSLEAVKHIDNTKCKSDINRWDDMLDLITDVRQGDASTLNIVYVQGNRGDGTKGVCSQPRLGARLSDQALAMDGCVVAMDTLPEGNDGKDPVYPAITIHEAGHWLSLDHTVGDNGNVMTSNLLEKTEYSFNEVQLKQMRQKAVERLEQSNLVESDEPPAPRPSKPAPAAVPGDAWVWMHKK
ncbi:hypothetical protein V2A60_008272 [Cordyceps javanica]|uniref:Metalloprotease 1 n=1 Tax=Cordyceps javanica TaxID=43265 RepID=A0A545UMA6_9HYPO|nr:hypothetical protein IF1G_10748 [Cordyceps javanica]TQW02043.1 metallo-peptidase family m12B reprolysin-like domain-containing protein [Cordyceps javanica]